MKVSKLAFLPLLAVAIAGCGRSDSGGGTRPAGDVAAPAAIPAAPAAAAKPGQPARAPRPRTVATAEHEATPEATPPAVTVTAPALATVAEERSASAPAAVAPVEVETRAKDAAGPAPVVLGTSSSDLSLAYADAAGRTYPDVTELGGGNLDGLVLAPGLYRWSAGVTIPGEVTLAGGADDVWIFQIARDLVMPADAMVTLTGGARARNVFWLVAGQARLGPAAIVQGTILSRPVFAARAGDAPGGVAPARAAVVSQTTASRTP